MLKNSFFFWEQTPVCLLVLDSRPYRSTDRAQIRRMDSSLPGSRHGDFFFGPLFCFPAMADKTSFLGSVAPTVRPIELKMGGWIRLYWDRANKIFFCLPFCFFTMADNTPFKAL